jgi:3-oxoacyl-[acyl-carrier protein] reductase
VALVTGPSKGEVNAFVRAAALELGPFDITVNAIGPGTVDTEGLRSAFSQEEIDAIGADTPLTRVGEAEDVALVALFFASDYSRFVTGQMLAVDGDKTLSEDRTTFPA